MMFSCELHDEDELRVGLHVDVLHGGQVSCDQFSFACVYLKRLNKRR